MNTGLYQVDTWWHVVINGHDYGPLGLWLFLIGGIVAVVTFWRLKA